MGAEYGVYYGEGSGHQRAVVDAAQRGDAAAIIESASFKENLNMRDRVNNRVIDNLRQIITLERVHEPRKENGKT